SPVFRPTRSGAGRAPDSSETCLTARFVARLTTPKTAMRPVLPPVQTAQSSVRRKTNGPPRMAGRAVAFTSAERTRGRSLAAARRFLAVGGVVPLGRGLLLVRLRLRRDERLVREQFAVRDDGRSGLVGRSRHRNGILRSTVVGEGAFVSSGHR